jgi:hypothetical protein
MHGINKRKRKGLTHPPANFIVTDSDHTASARRKFRWQLLPARNAKQITRVFVINNSPDDNSLVLQTIKNHPGMPAAAV